jgi:hypothetical protein
MTTVRLITLFLFAMALSACGSIYHPNVYMTKDGQPKSKRLTNEQQDTISGLKAALMKLGPNISEAEATRVAYDAVVYPLILSNQYRLTYPPLHHNVLVNTGKRSRGLCYEWAEDMTAHMKTLNLKTFDLKRATSNRHLKDEHNVLVMVAKGGKLEDGILLDPWRNSGKLYWTRLPKDPVYKWVAFY